MKNKSHYNILILGATSAIAQATAKQLVNEGHHLFLVARNKEKLDIVVADLNARSQKEIQYKVCDLNDTEKHGDIIAEASRALGKIDIVLIAYGTLSNQEACQECFETTFSEIKTNFLSVVSFLTKISPTFKQQQHGTIAVISSAAGDRGRQSNYIYGTAKGALSLFLQGLRSHLNKYNVHVLTIKPGFVDTPMTKEFKKGLLWASPEKVAADIVKGIYKNKQIIYTPGFWRFIMLIVKIIPERIFMKLSF